MTPITAPQTPSSTGSLATAPHFSCVWNKGKGQWEIRRDGRPIIWLESCQHHMAYHIIKRLEAEHDS